MNLKRSLENLFKLNSVLLTTRSSSDPTQAVPVTSDDPLPVLVVGGTAGGGSSSATDPGSNREATQQEVLAALQSTITTQRATQLTVPSPLTIAAGANLSDSVNLTGRSLIRLTIGAAWTAADLTVQTSPDGATWYDLYDEYGTPYTIKAAANRTVFINPGPLLAANFIRLRSGTPAAPVNQASAATVTLASVAL